MTSESMMLATIAVDYRIWFAGKCRLDLGLCWLGNELVLLSQMQPQRRIQTVDLAQVFLGVTAVIDNRSVDGVARGRQEGHQPSEAIAEDSNSADALRKPGYDVGGVPNVP